MIDLKSIMQSNSGCLSSRASFKSVLMDKYPGEKRTVNILTIMYECGIVQKIKSKSQLGENDFQAIILQLENDYGIIAKYSSECVSIWADALGVAVQAFRQQTSPLVIHEQIVHKPIVDEVVVEGSKSDYETEILKSGELRITKFIGFDEREIIVPNQLDGKKVTVIGENAFAKCKGIHKVVIPEGIVTIENGAFSGCESLLSVSLPTTLKWLGNKPKITQPAYSWGKPTEQWHDGVFQRTALVAINLPSGLTFLGKKAFQGCTKLTQIDIPNGIKVIPEECFSSCANLKTVVLPDELTTIESNAFHYTGIERIDIPTSCVEIQSSAFSLCSKLNKVLLHEGLVKIGASAFENCKAFPEITIPMSVKDIGLNVFDITEWHQPYDRRRKGFSTSEKRKDLVIACYAGSFALEWARKEGFQVKNAAK